MDPDAKRLLEPVLSKLMEHFTSQMEASRSWIQQLEKRVECAETNVATEAARVRAELLAEHEKAVAEMRREHTETVSSLARVQAELRAEHEKAVAKQRAEHEKAVAEMRREHTAAVSSLGSGLHEVRTTLKVGLPGFEQKVTAQMEGLSAAVKGEQQKVLLSEVQRAAEQLSSSTAAHQQAVLQAGLPQVEAWVQAGAVISCGEARKRGAPSLRELRERGVTIVEAKIGGYMLTEMHEAMYSCKEAREAGYINSCTEARQVGYSCKEAKEAGYSCTEAQGAGFSADEGRGVYPCVVSRRPSCLLRT